MWKLRYYSTLPGPLGWADKTGEEIDIKETQCSCSLPFEALFFPPMDISLCSGTR